MTTEGPNSLFIRILNPPLLNITVVSPSLPVSLIVPSDSSDANKEVQKKARRTFCPEELRSQVVEIGISH